MLTSMYTDPHFIIERVREVVYRLQLLEQLLRVHNVFHVSQLRKYIPDPTIVIKARTFKASGILNL